MTEDSTQAKTQGHTVTASRRKKERKGIEYCETETIKWQNNSHILVTKSHHKCSNCSKETYFVSSIKILSLTACMLNFRLHCNCKISAKYLLKQEKNPSDVQQISKLPTCN